MLEGDGDAEALEVFFSFFFFFLVGGGGGGHLSRSHAHTPTQIFQNALCVVRWHKQTSLQSLQCLVCK